MIVVAETRTSTRHQELEALGALPLLREMRTDSEVAVARNVLVCIPPSSAGTAEYEGELYQACRLWAGPAYGNLVFTSSTAVYGDSFGNTVTETFRVHT